MSYNPNYKWINPTYPIYNWGYNPLTKWDEPPRMPKTRNNDMFQAAIHPEILTYDPPDLGLWRSKNDLIITIWL